MENLTEIQTEMFQKEELLIDMANIFDALASDCRLEIIFSCSVLMPFHQGDRSPYELFSITSISVSLEDVGCWYCEEGKDMEGSRVFTDKSDPFVQGIVALLSVYMK